jgi:hypothetical protein
VNKPVPVLQIDNVKKELRRTSANVKLLENSLRPFCRLYPDIIIGISAYLDPRACNNGYEPLLCATQICRNWRDTLISQPSLWSFISGSRTDLVPCLLNRSKHARLDVHIVSHRIQEVIGYINPHVDRLSSIHLELSRGDDVVFEAIRHLNAAPKLSRLNIECWGGISPDPSGYTPGIVGPVPSLHDLQLFRFPITPELIQLRNLTTVGLDASRTTQRAVLQLLSRNQLLEIVRLWGTYLSEDLDGGRDHPPGSITLPHLKVLLLEMTPLAHLEALSTPHGARVLSGFRRGSGPNYFGGGTYATSFTIPRSFSNLRDLRKLRVVDEVEIYVKLEGEKGSVTYCLSRVRPFNAGTFAGVPLDEVTDAVYEISPKFWHQDFVTPTTTQPMVSRIVYGMARLQKLELSCCSAKELEYFLLVLWSTNVCKDLKVLVLSHCKELYRQMRTLAGLATSRKAADIGLDIVRIIHSNIGQLKATFKQENVARLERAIGTLEYVEPELGRSGQSSLRFDPEAGLAQPFTLF